MRSLKILPALLAASLLAVPAFAQPPAGRAPAAAHAKKTPAERAANRETRRLEAMKKAGVDDARARQAVATMKRFDGERAPVMKQTREAMKKLRELRKSKSNDTAARDAARKEVKAGRDKIKDIGKRERAELAKVLKPAELAKLDQARHGKRDHAGKRGHGGKQGHGKRDQQKS